MILTNTFLSPIHLIIFGTFLGMAMGSFISMLSWRLPRVLLGEESENTLVSKSRSYCPNCQTTLPWYRLIPIFSWLFSKGKCHKCKNKISIRYPIIEIFSAISTAYILWNYGISGTTLAILVINWFLLTISIVDIEHQLILDVLSLPLLWIGLIISTQNVFVSAENAIWGAALGYTLLWSVFHLFRIITGKEGMGYGDFKFMAALGALFGAKAISVILFIAAISSILITVLLVVFRLRSLNAPMAFGPFLAIAGWAVLFAGDILEKYAGFDIL